MKYFLIVATLLSGVSLTACAVHTPDGSIVIDPDGYYGGHGGGGHFCPPGQAKKGNC